MDEQPNLQQEHGASYMGRVLYWSAAIGAVVIVALLIYGTFSPHPHPAASSTSVSSMNDAIRSGNYLDALASYNTITNNPQASADEHARAVLDAVGVSYQLSGNGNDWLSEVRDMKREIQNPDVSPNIRATLVTQLAMLYSESGRSSAVFSEIFKQDDPFSQYFVDGDIVASLRSLVEWSYSISPTAYAAMYLAESYSASAFTDSSKIDAAKRYYMEGDKLLTEELAYGDTSPQSSRYAITRLWHAITLSRFAALRVGTYTMADARKEFSDLFTFIQAQNSVPLKEKLLTYAQLFYGLYVAADTADAKATLDTLSGELSALKGPDVNYTVLLIRDAYRNKNGWWEAVSRGMSISPEFNAVVQKLVIDKQAGQ